MKEGKFPDITVVPPTEVWKAAEKNEEMSRGEEENARNLSSGTVGNAKAWSRSRVFNDILKKSMLEFSPDQRDQWRALD
eukprot:42219-Pleurochrysis_carterae.AAC.1